MTFGFIPPSLRASESDDGHPLRVEVVAWCSAQPYALAGMGALVACHAHLCDRRQRPRVAAAALQLVPNG